MRKGAVLAALAGGIMLFGAGVASADAGATGAAIGSPGVLSGNLIQVPVHVPVNACGNSVNVIGLLNPAFGNTCANVDGGSHDGRMSDDRMSDGRMSDGRTDHAGMTGDHRDGLARQDRDHSAHAWHHMKDDCK
jgi:hypothetical protein